jgi:GAF domain-containing protein
VYYSQDELKPIIQEAQAITRGDDSRDEKLLALCRLLRDRIPHYDWVGFYFADVAKRELTLGPFVGEPTEHTRIAFGQGICGQAAAVKKPFIVQDVRRVTNYLSCGVKVMSEIVFPIFKDGTIVGELDIDSHTVAPFTEKDSALLEKICDIVGPLL